MWLEDNQELNELIEHANKIGIDYDMYEGVLQNNFIFYTHNPKNKEDEKYMIIVEKHLNEWSSGLTVILTNSDEEAEQFIKSFEEIAC